MWTTAANSLYFCMEFSFIFSSCIDQIKSSTSFLPPPPGICPVDGPRATGIDEGLPGVLGNKGTWSFISREHGIFLGLTWGTRDITTLIEITIVSVWSILIGYLGATRRTKISWLPVPGCWDLSDCQCGFVISSCNLWHLGSFLDTMKPFYINYSSSVCYLTLFKLIKNLSHQSFLFRFIFRSRILCAHTKPSIGL